MTHKLQEMLRNIANGLHANGAVSTDEKLKFIYKYVVKAQLLLACLLPAFCTCAPWITNGWGVRPVAPLFQTYG